MRMLFSIENLHPKRPSLIKEPLDHVTACDRLEIYSPQQALPFRSFRIQIQTEKIPDSKRQVTKLNGGRGDTAQTIELCSDVGRMTTSSAPL